MSFAHVQCYTWNDTADFWQTLVLQEMSVEPNFLVCCDWVCGQINCHKNYQRSSFERVCNITRGKEALRNPLHGGSFSTDTTGFFSRLLRSESWPAAWPSFVSALSFTQPGAPPNTRNVWSVRGHWKVVNCYRDLMQHFSIQDPILV